MANQYIETIKRLEYQNRQVVKVIPWVQRGIEQQLEIVSKQERESWLESYHDLEAEIKELKAEAIVREAVIRKLLARKKRRTR